MFGTPAMPGGCESIAQNNTRKVAYCLQGANRSYKKHCHSHSIGIIKRWYFSTEIPASSMCAQYYPNNTLLNTLVTQHQKPRVTGSLGYKSKSYSSYISHNIEENKICSMILRI